MKRNISRETSIFILTIGIVVSSIYLGYSIQEYGKMQVGSNEIEQSIFTLEEVAEYIRMTEEEVEAIIKTEEKELSETGSFSGGMFPYFIVDGEKYFYKESVNQWLIEANNREYDLKYWRLIK